MQTTSAVGRIQVSVETAALLEQLEDTEKVEKAKSWLTPRDDVVEAKGMSCCWIQDSCVYWTFLDGRFV